MVKRVEIFDPMDPSQYVGTVIKLVIVILPLMYLYLVVRDFWVYISVAAAAYIAYRIYKAKVVIPRLLAEFRAPKPAITLAGGRVAAWNCADVVRRKSATLGIDTKNHVLRYRHKKNDTFFDIGRIRFAQRQFSKKGGHYILIHYVMPDQAIPSELGFFAFPNQSLADRWFGAICDQMDRVNPPAKK